MTGEQEKTATFIHPSADVSATADIGTGTSIWHQVQVSNGAKIGKNSNLGKGVYVGGNVVIGDNVKIQNGCFVYAGATLEHGVFLGPGVILTNDKVPRAINFDGSLKGESDWSEGKILIKRGASLGAGSIILTDLVIGQFAMVGAGSVVTKDVPDFGQVVGSPAKLLGFVCHCGHRLEGIGPTGSDMEVRCSQCKTTMTVPLEQWDQTV
jgi:UDP-2-acetamido-3-amino-2,3-dideoxy-glucuronate N-acetyltransferase